MFLIFRDTLAMGKDENRDTRCRKPWIRKCATKKMIVGVDAKGYIYIKYNIYAQQCAKCKEEYCQVDKWVVA